MTVIAEKFFAVNEPFAAGFFEDESKSKFERVANATLRFRETCSLPRYDGQWLYPNGKAVIDPYAVYPQFSYVYQINEAALGRKDEALKDYCLANMPRSPVVNENETEEFFGRLYTHTNANNARILREGLCSYEERIKRAKISTEAHKHTHY